MNDVSGATMLFGVIVGLTIGGPTWADDASMALPGLPTTAPPPILRLEDLERIALEENVTLEQSFAKFQEARARAYQAGVHPNPILAYDSGSLGEEGTPGLHGAFMDHPIITFGKLRTNRNRFQVEVEQGVYDMEHQRHRIINGVRLRYFRILALQRLIDLHREMVATAERVVVLTERMIEAGHAEEPALLRAQNQVRKTRLALSSLHVRYDQTWRELAAFLGRPQMTPVPLEGDLERAHHVPRFEVCLERLIAESPEMRVIQLWVLREQYTLEFERRTQFPDWIIRLGVEHDYTVNQTLPMFRFTTQVPLWDRNRGNIEMTRQDVRDNRLNVERFKLELQHRLAQVYHPYINALQTAQEYREHILPTARQIFEEYVELFLEEEESYSRVEGTEQELFEVSIRYIEALLEAREAEVMIHGLLIADTLEEPKGTPTGTRPTRVPVSP